MVVSLYLFILWFGDHSLGGGGEVLIDTDFIMKYLCNNKTCKSPCFGDSTGLRLTEW